MKQSLRILIVNNTLNALAGTELYVLELAKHLVKLGHKPVAYSTDLGTVAYRLRSEGIPVIDDLSTIGAKPDIIHGHHHLDTLSALLHFSDVPAVYFCHGWLPWQEAPLCFPRIYKYIAVCDLSAERLIVEGGISPEKINMVLNFVDLERFKPRKPLPDSPRKALAFSGYMNTERVRLIKAACDRCGIRKLDKIGWHISKTHPKPEAVLGEYDIVFAKGRAALEALATGAAVVSCDGAGSMVTTENFERQRIANFGLSERQYPYTIETIVNEIRQYDRHDAARVNDLVRSKASKEITIANILDLYNAAIEEHRSEKNWNPVLEMKIVSDYLRRFKINLTRVSAPLTFNKKILFIIKKIIKKMM